MSFRIEVRPAVLGDVAEAHDWYEQRQAGLGDDFLDAFFSGLEEIAKHADIYAKVYRDIRHVLLQRFPFGVYYRVEQDVAVIFRVYHGARNPAALKRSLRTSE